MKKLIKNNNGQPLNGTSGAYVDLTSKSVTVGFKNPDDGYKTLVFNTGSDVLLVNRAECFDSVIADGKELQDGSKSGQLRVSSLIDGNVKIKFKNEITDIKNVFGYCSNLITIPQDLFDKCSNVDVQLHQFQQDYLINVQK